MSLVNFCQNMLHLHLTNVTFDPLTEEVLQLGFVQLKHKQVVALLQLLLWHFLFLRTG